MSRRSLAAAFVASTLLSLVFVPGCRKSETNQVEGYCIIDVQASDEWKANHSITATWRQKGRTLPAVFKVVGTSGVRTDASGSCVVTISGESSVIKVTPNSALHVANGRSFLLFVPADGGTSGTKVVNYFCLAPSGSDTGTVTEPSQAEVEKLLQGKIAE